MRVRDRAPAAKDVHRTDASFQGPMPAGTPSSPEEGAATHFALLLRLEQDRIHVACEHLHAQPRVLLVVDRSEGAKEGGLDDVVARDHGAVRELRLERLHVPPELLQGVVGPAYALLPLVARRKVCPRLHKGRGPQRVAEGDGEGQGVELHRPLLVLVLVLVLRHRLPLRVQPRARRKPRVVPLLAIPRRLPPPGVRWQGLLVRGLWHKGRDREDLPTLRGLIRVLVHLGWHA
mmetsp:Transcript_57374/g.140697  ORF Transcript_57374/g.140697 Transcript_57374/m.140697 type:complete len:233 (-) Transcript_57374:493-1191(-)